MKEHDDLLFNISDEELKRKLINYLGKPGCWGYHDLIDKEQTEKTIKEVREAFSGRHYGIESNLIPFEKIIQDMTLSRKQCNEHLEKNDIVDFEKTYEHPLLTGHENYKKEIGFIDLVVSIKPKIFGEYYVFSTFQNKEEHEFIIEVKKEKDFQDFGQILRQIKTYREHYYGRNQKYNGKKIYFFVAATRIPEKYKNILKNEKIEFLEIGAL